MKLHEVAIKAGVRLQTHAEVNSTNEAALTVARAGGRGPLWIIAQGQTAGRGRRGRCWHSQPGNLFASLLLNDPGPVENTAQLSFVAALALHDAILAVAPELDGRLALKWPNDILLDEAKMAGILVEGERLADGTFAAAIGIGVNCVQHPADVGYPATNLAAGGVESSAEDLFVALSGAMPMRLSQWRRGAGFDTLRSDWLARAAGIGRPLRVAFSDRETFGVFEAIDDGGRLVLRLPNGQAEIVTAADVVPLQKSPSAFTSPALTSSTTAAGDARE